MLATTGRPSGTFLASELLSGKRAGQGWFWRWLGVLPKSSPWGVGVEPEEVIEAFLGGVGVGEDALRAGTAFVPGGVRTLDMVRAKPAALTV